MGKGLDEMSVCVSIPLLPRRRPRRNDCGHCVCRRTSAALETAAGLSERPGVNCPRACDVPVFRFHFGSLQVQHFSTFQGHSAAVCGVAQEKGLFEILSVSQDRTLRCWPLMKGNR